MADEAADHEVRLVEHRRRCGDAHSSQLLRHDAHLRESETRAAILLRRGHPEQAQLRGPRPALGRKALLTVDLASERGDLLAGECANHLAEHSVLVREIPQHLKSISP